MLQKVMTPVPGRKNCMYRYDKANIFQIALYCTRKKSNVVFPGLHVDAFFQEWRFLSLLASKFLPPLLPPSHPLAHQESQLNRQSCLHKKSRLVLHSRITNRQSIVTRAHTSTGAWSSTCASELASILSPQAHSSTGASFQLASTPSLAHRTTAHF